MIHWNIHYELIEKYLNDGDRVIELGDQEVRIDQKWQSAAVGRYLDSRSFYESLDIVSIDINGEHGALPLNLSKTIEEEDLPKRGDFLTDFGTIEHVKSLYHALKNCFNLVEYGGVFMHANPMSGKYIVYDSEGEPFPHGWHYFTTGFWTEYVKKSGMEMIELRPQMAFHNEEGYELYAVFKKIEGSKFPTKRVFDSLYKKHIKKS